MVTFSFIKALYEDRMALRLLVVTSLVGTVTFGVIFMLDYFGILEVLI